MGSNTANNKPLLEEHHQVRRKTLKVASLMLFGFREELKGMCPLEAI